MVARLLGLAVWAAAVAVAEYDSFTFTSNKTVDTHKCQGIAFNCPPPSICAHDILLDKYYCCGSGSPDAVCWTGSTRCSGSGTASAGSGQIDCGSYCCLSGKEQCTQRTGQVNICWATQADPVANISETSMNQTYTSLLRQNPTAANYTISLAQLTATSTGYILNNTSVPSNDPSDAGSSNGLSGGAIAGIVVGTVLGLALVVGIVIFVLRSRRNSKKVTPSQEPYRPTPYGPEKYQYGAPQHGQTTMEMDGRRSPAPVQEWYGPPVEADSTPFGTYNSHQYRPISELPANTR